MCLITEKHSIQMVKMEILICFREHHGPHKAETKAWCLSDASSVKQGPEESYHPAVIHL